MSSPYTTAVLRRFNRLYLPIMIPLNLITMLVTALYWNAPTPTPSFFHDLPWPVFALILGPVSLVVTALSYIAQRKALMRLLRQGPFRPASFTIVFYASNLAISIILSIITFPVTAILLFGVFELPILFSLIPTHLIGGIILATALHTSLDLSPLTTEA